jgi:hypothetical protein
MCCTLMAGTMQEVILQLENVLLVGEYSSFKHEADLTWTDEFPTRSPFDKHRGYYIMGDCQLSYRFFDSDPSDEISNMKI